jgi:hypothetical protein
LDDWNCPGLTRPPRLVPGQLILQKQAKLLDPKTLARDRERCHAALFMPATVLVAQLAKAHAERRLLEDRLDHHPATRGAPPKQSPLRAKALMSKYASPAAGSRQLGLQHGKGRADFYTVRVYEPYDKRELPAYSNL